MAYLKSAKGSQLLVLVGDGADPEVFSHPCTINADREFTLEVTFNDSDQIDCDDPEAPAWLERTPATKAGTITGGGRLNTPDYEDWFEWAQSGEPRNVRVKMNVPAADGGVTVSGMFVLSTLGMAGARGGTMEGNVTLLSHGPLTIAANAA